MTIVSCFVEVIVLSSDSEEEKTGGNTDEKMDASERGDPKECTEDRVRPYFFELTQLLELPRFGGARGTTKAEEFLAQLEATYEEYKCYPSEGLMMAECHLDSKAEKWWKRTRENAEEYYGGNVWEQFKRAFTGEYMTQKLEFEVEKAGPSRRRPDKRVEEISGMVKVEGHPARALFDTGSTHSHVDEEYAKEKGLRLYEFQRKEKIMYADGRQTFASMVCKTCILEVGGLRTHAELTVSKIGPVDVLIGMDWLGAHHAHIDCRNGEIEFRMPGWPIFKFQGDQGEE